MQTLYYLYQAKVPFAGICNILPFTIGTFELTVTSVTSLERDDTSNIQSVKEEIFEILK